MPEKLDLKVKVLKQVDEFVTDQTIIASSTSCIMPSKFTGELKHKAQCIVAHPVRAVFIRSLLKSVSFRLK